MAEESRKLTTFYTHSKAAFRVNSAAEIFNEEVCKIVAQEPDAASIYDGILVFGATPEEHDEALGLIFKL